MGRNRERPLIPFVAILTGVTLLVACTSPASHPPATPAGHQPSGPDSLAPTRDDDSAPASPPVDRNTRVAGRRMPASAACPSATPVYLESQGPVVVTNADGLTVSGLIRRVSATAAR